MYASTVCSALWKLGPMDMTSNTSNTTVASSALPHNHQEQAMVESLPTPKGDRRNLKAKQQTQATSITSGERKPRPQHDEALKCPRCDTTDTKFCYYNNKSLMQPRYFCEACRRYWTQGGILRDVPVGGGSRKNKRNSAALSSSATATSSSNTASSATKIISSSTHQLMMMMPTPMTTMDFSSVQPTTFMTATGGRSFEEHQVSLSFASLSSLSYNETSGGGSRGMTASFMDMLRGGFLDSNDRSNGNRMPMPFSLPSLDAMPMHATQLVGSLQEQGGRNTTTGGLQQWPSSQYRSINDGGFTAGSSSSAAVQQQQQQHVGDHSVRQQEHRASIMDFWSDSTGSVLGTVDQVMHTLNRCGKEASPTTGAHLIDHEFIHASSKSKLPIISSSH